MPVQISDLFPSFQSVLGPTMPLGTDLVALIRQMFSYSNGLTALAGGGQTGATPVTSFINEVSTVATAADSVMLPLALPGAMVVLINSAAAAMQVFGQANNPNTGVGDTIAPATSATQAATGTGVSHAAVTGGFYFCFSAGKWKQVL